MNYFNFICRRSFTWPIIFLTLSFSSNSAIALETCAYLIDRNATHTSRVRRPGEVITHAKTTSFISEFFRSSQFTSITLREGKLLGRRAQLLGCELSGEQNDRHNFGLNLILHPSDIRSRSSWNTHKKIFSINPKSQFNILKFSRRNDYSIRILEIESLTPSLEYQRVLLKRNSDGNMTVAFELISSNGSSEIYECQFH